jgi:hypothetical protein
MGMYELMVIDDELREMVVQGASTVAIREKACFKGMRLLREDGLDKVLKGLTTWGEVSRVVEERMDVTPLVEVPTHLERPVIQTETQTPEAVQQAAAKIKPADVEDYEKKIASWLTRKK